MRRYYIGGYGGVDSDSYRGANHRRSFGRTQSTSYEPTHTKSTKYATTQL